MLSWQPTRVREDEKPSVPSRKSHPASLRANREKTKKTPPPRYLVIRQNSPLRSNRSKPEGTRIDFVPHFDDNVSRLHTAAECGDIATIQMLYTKGVNLNARNENGETAMYIAALYNQLSTVRFLRRLGGCVHIPDKLGQTPLFIAATENLVDMVILLHSFGASVNFQNTYGCSPMYGAAMNGCMDMIELLSELNADIEATNKTGMSPSFIAAHEGRLEVLKALYILGANIHKPDCNGTGPIYVAACNGHIDVLKFLINHGGDVNEQNNHGLTPVHVAAHQHNHQILEYLFEQGALMNAKDIYGRFPVDVVSEHGHGRSQTINLLKYFRKISLKRNNVRLNPWRAIQRHPVLITPKKMPKALENIVTSVFNLQPSKEICTNHREKCRHKYGLFLSKPGVTVSRMGSFWRKSKYDPTPPPPPPPPPCSHASKLEYSNGGYNIRNDEEAEKEKIVSSLRHGYVKVYKKIVSDISPKSDFPPPPEKAPPIKLLRPPPPPPPPLPAAELSTDENDYGDRENSSSKKKLLHHPKRLPPSPLKRRLYINDVTASPDEGIHLKPPRRAPPKCPNSVNTGQPHHHSRPVRKSERPIPSISSLKKIFSPSLINQTLAKY